MTRDEARLSLSTLPRWSDAWWAAAAGLLVRLAVVAWAHGRIPPTADGHYYHVVARRIAMGEGYTWVWPDGAVTYAAHYPVGYPAAVGALYAALGSAPVWGMLLNAVLGAAAVVAAHRIAASVATRWGAWLAAGLVALHPALVAYTPALMTEGVVAAMLSIAGAIAVEARSLRGWALGLALFGLGLVLGLTTLVRPQTLLLAPFFGVVAVAKRWDFVSFRRGAGAAVLVGGLAFVTCLPWSIRNCFMMNAHEPGQFDSKACVFVSANGGWNLLIGAAPKASGSWVPLEVIGVPPECREVFAEADKDRCFGRAGWRYIRSEPGRWLSLVPRKLGATFNGCGAAGWYLNAANHKAFSGRAQERLNAVETVFQRLLLLGCLAALARAEWSRRPRGWRSWVLVGVLGVGAIWAVQVSAWVAYLVLPVGAAMLGKRLAHHPPALLAAATVLVTSATHAVFFGAGRYSMVCFAVMAALAGSVLLGTRLEDELESGNGNGF